MGFGTLRMEPCWMALGQAAGTAAHLAREQGVALRAVPIAELQRRLLRDGAVLVYFRDLPRGHPASAGIQYWAARGFFATYDARPDGALTRGQAAIWLARALGAYGEEAHHGDRETRRRAGIKEGENALTPLSQPFSVSPCLRGEPFQSRFVDIRAEYPAAGAIAALEEKGVLEGDQPRDEFRPAEALTWSELDGWLHRAYGVRLESLRFTRHGERPYALRGEFCTLLFQADERGLQGG
jgi:hypothetical protein